MRTAMVARLAGQTADSGRSLPKNGTALPRISTPLLLFFHAVARRRLSRSFRAVRIAHEDRVAATSTGSLIVAINHPSWWDPLVGFVLARRLFRHRNFFAPMDEIALQRYGIFRRLGMFPVAMHSARGAAQFLRAASEVLERKHILGITPQGQFTDVRERPVTFRPGLAALLHRRAAQGRATTVLPIALEYTFWDQRLPEVLVNCGEPVAVLPGEQASAATSLRDIQQSMEAAMARTQDELAALALRRDPRDFASVLEGSRGSAGFYGWIERFRAALRGGQGLGDHLAARNAASSNTPITKP